jgi:hypothetical protein
MPQKRIGQTRPAVVLTICPIRRRVDHELSMLRRLIDGKLFYVQHFLPPPKKFYVKK